MRVTSIPAFLPVVALLVGVSTRVPVQAQTTPNEGPGLKERFQEAEDLARKGLYDAAKKAYARLAKEYPSDDLGREAAVRAKPNAYLRLLPLAKTGDSNDRVDVVILGDGYTIDPRQQQAFDRQAKAIVEGFGKVSPWAEYASYFNWWEMSLSSAESRLDTPTREADTVLGGGMSKFSQGQVTVDRDVVHDFLRKYAPFADTSMVIVKQGSLGTGGGDVAVFGPGGVSVAIHEFGHSFGDLLDEYSSQVELHPSNGRVHGVNLVDSKDLDRCPWRHWIEAGTKGVGFFEGGAGRSRGVWHPSNQGCAMNGSGSAYCVVCREQLVRRIYRYAKPIEASYPDGAEVRSTGTAPAIFSVTPKKPKDHYLTVDWTVDGTPAKGKRDLSDEGVFEVLRIEPGALASGTHHVVAKVKDPTDWVLKDEEGALSAAREWTLVVESRRP
jgi:IgA peptidase M64